MRARRAQQGGPERVLGAYGTDVLDEAVAPGPVVYEVDDGRQADRGDRHGSRPQPPTREGRAYGLVQRPPLARARRTTLFIRPGQVA